MHEELSIKPKASDDHLGTGGTIDRQHRHQRMDGNHFMMMINDHLIINDDDGAHHIHLDHFMTMILIEKESLYNL